MKLSPEELEKLNALVARATMAGSRSEPGKPGCRTLPLSLEWLIAQRKAVLASGRD